MWFEAKTHQQVIWTAMAEQTRHISTDMGRVERQEVWLPVALLFAMSGDVVCSLPPITLSRIQARKEATERHIRGGRVDEMHMRWIQLSQCVATD